MPEFGVGKYSPDFEARAFSLKNHGEISRPFKTIFGYHIIKLISSHPVVSDKAEELAEKVRQQVVQDSRMNIARNKLISTARIITGFHSFHLPEADVYKITDSSLIAGKDIASGQVNKKSILFKFNDGSEVSLNDWIQYAKNSDKVLNTDLHHSYQALWPEFESYQIVNNYKSRLDQFDRDFSRQMQEFKEGNMLFEMMQRKVWNLASEDSVGLKKYYQLHSERYRWKKSADVIIFSCSNEEVAQRCINELRTMPWDEVLRMNAINLQADSGRFEIDQLPVKISIEKAGVTSVVVNDFDKTATFLQVLKIYPGNIQRDFNDARGLVVEDYQTQLENDWIKKLRLKYPVTINQKAWSSIQK
jgi:peptidyl-prolyl cis-trans isomerase SurA